MIWFNKKVKENVINMAAKDEAKYWMVNSNKVAAC